MSSRSRLPRPRAPRGGGARHAWQRLAPALIAGCVAWASWVGWVHAVLHAPHGGPADAAHVHRHADARGRGADDHHHHDHHGHHGHRHDAAAATHGDEPVSAGGLAALFGHEDGSVDCTVYDQLTHVDGFPTVAQPAFDRPSPLAPSTRHPDGRPVLAAGFRLARGPPAGRPPPPAHG